MTPVRSDYFKSLNSQHKCIATLQEFECTSSFLFVRFRARNTIACMYIFLKLQSTNQFELAQGF